jgi:hypothetical protein
MGLVADATCRECEIQEETVAHFVGSCERYAAVRFQIFGTAILPGITFSRADGARVLEFVNRVARFADPL